MPLSPLHSRCLAACAALSVILIVLDNWDFLLFLTTIAFPLSFLSLQGGPPFHIYQKYQKIEFLVYEIMKHTKKHNLKYIVNYKQQFHIYLELESASILSTIVVKS
jgi:hypothetical protein